MEDDSATSIWASVNSWFTSTVFFILLNLMIATIFFTSNLSNNNNQQNHHHQQEEEKQKQKENTQIARSTSILNRLKSFNFLPDISQQKSESESDHHQQQQPLQVAATQYVFNQPLDYQHFNYHFDSTGSDPHTETHVVWEHQKTEITHFDFDPTREEIRPETAFEDDGFQSLDEVYSKLKTGHHDRTKSEGDLAPKPPAKMKKSASLKVGFVAHLEEEEEEVEVVEARRPVTVRERKSARRMMQADDVEVDTKADDFINKFKNDLKLQRIESIMRTKGATGRGTRK